MQISAIVSVAVFSIILVIIGLYYKNKTSSEDFFMAGRGANAWRIIASTFTLVGAGEIVTLTAFAYLFGYTGIAIFLGFFAGAILTGFLVGRIRLQAEEYKPYTITDYFARFVGPKSEKIALILQLVGIGSLLLIQLVVGGLLISTLTGFAYPLSVALIGLIVVIYLNLGGLHSVFVTDLLQALALLIALILLLFLYNPTGSSIGDLITLTRDIIPNVDLAVLFVSGLFAVLGGADVIQRVLAAKSDATAKGGIWLAGLAILAFGFLMLTLGLQIFTQFPNADPNNAFFEFLGSSLSPVLLSVVSVFLVASIFSTADSQLLLTSILFGKLIKGGKELSHALGQALLWGVVIVVSLLAIFLTELVDIYFVLLFALAIVGPAFLVRLLGRGNDNTAFWGMLVSTLMLIGMTVTGTLVGWYPILLVVPPMVGFFVPAPTRN